MARVFTGQGIRELFSNNLKKLRLSQNLSQLALSSKAGLAHNFVNDIENNKKWVSPDTIAKLANALGVEPGDLFRFNPLTGPETDKILYHLDEIGRSFSQAVGEIRSAYLQGTSSGKHHD